jgi:transposase
VESAAAVPAGQQPALWAVADHRQVIDAIPHRVRTGVPWRDLPERFGRWKTVYERHRLWSTDGTWEQLLQQVQAAADAAGEIDWDILVDSTIVRAHQHAADARTAPRPAAASKGRAINRLKQSRAVATRYDKRGYVYLGTTTAAALTIWLRT